MDIEGVREEEPRATLEVEPKSVHHAVLAAMCFGGVGRPGLAADIATIETSLRRNSVQAVAIG